MKKAIILLAMLYSILTLFSQTTFIVGFPELHPGIDFYPGGIMGALAASADGDTIVVYPGTYLATHINFSGKNIYMTSLYKYSGNRNDIYNTIFDGTNTDGSLFVFINNETRDAVLNGFTIQNGNGTQAMPLINPQFRQGGGIYIANASPTILNCIIQNNTANSGGGGIFISSTAVVPSYLAGNIIKNNNSNGLGGGLRIGGNQVQFDPINKNSVFLNDAPEHRDISSASQQYLSVVLDTFTVSTDDPYYINMSGPYDFSCDHWVIEQVDQDIYVSTSGSDTNTGLTHNNPLKTINEAMLRIKSNPESRNTIHVGPGIYKASEGQIFPIKIKSDVILQGAGASVHETAIDLEGSTGAIHSFAGARNFRISGIAFYNNWDQTGSELRKAPIVLSNTVNCEISDCYFENNLYGIQAYDANNHVSLPEPILLRNLSFMRNYNHVLDLFLVNAVIENIKILNNSFNTLGGSIPNFTGTPVRINSNQRMRATYTLSNILIASSNDFGVEYSMNDAFGASAFDIGNNMDVLINNATIVGCFPVVNKENYFPSDVMWIKQDSIVRTYNSIFYNNYTNIIRVMGGTLYIDNTLIEGGQSKIIGNHVWGDGNIDEYPNFDWGYLGVEDWPYQLMASSPCVDAGVVDIPDYTWLTGDILGNTRIIGDTVDMGAYEFNGSSDFYVDFEGEPRIGEVPLTVQFTDTSIGYSITSWQWDFQNDGIIDSTEQNPTFTYYTTGQTTVKLVVNNGQGTRVKHEYINPRPATPTGGSLQGVVTSGGYPLSDVLVAITGTGLNTTSNEWGQYTIPDIEEGTYSIRAEKTGYDAYTHSGIIITIGQATTHNFIMTSEVDADSDTVGVPLVTGLGGNYPNPFNPETTITFSLAKQGLVEIEIYNIKGNKVKTLVKEHKSAGNHQVLWDGTDDRNRYVGSGIYFYRLKSGSYISTRKMLLLK